MSFFDRFKQMFASGSGLPIINVNKRFELMGRTGCNRVVNLVAGGNRPGDIVDVRISEVRGHSLRGELVS